MEGRKGCGWGQDRQFILGCRLGGALADGPGRVSYSPSFAAEGGHSPSRRSRRGSHQGGRTGNPWLVLEGLRWPCAQKGIASARRAQPEICGVGKACNGGQRRSIQVPTLPRFAYV